MKIIKETTKLEIELSREEGTLLVYALTDYAQNQRNREKEGEAFKERAIIVSEMANEVMRYVKLL